MKWLFNKIAGSKNRRELNKLESIVKKINAIDKEFQILTDDQLKEKTSAWKNTIKSFENDLDKSVTSWKEEQISSLRKPENHLIKDIEEKARRMKIDGLDEVYEKQSDFLNEILPQAYAVVKNGARRMIGIL